MKKGFLNTTVKKPTTGATAPPTQDQSSSAAPTPKAVKATSLRPPSNAAANWQVPGANGVPLPPASEPINLQHVPIDSTAKPPPFTSSRPPPFKYAYTPSPTSVDSNLLILLHGLGDHLLPFHNLGRRLQNSLPQTAVLAIQGACLIPWLSFPGNGEREGEGEGEEAKHWSYWEAISPLGETLPPHRQELGKFLSGFNEVMQELLGRCGWPARAIHLLGFGQGATAALEGAVHWARKQRSSGGEGTLGSIVAICGGLLSLPTFSPPLPIPTLYFHRPSKLNSTSSALNHMHRAFQHVTDLPFPSGPSRSGSGLPSEGQGAEEERMPSSQTEWDAIVHWWSQGGRWRNRGTWELQGGSGTGEGEGGLFRVN